MAFIAVAIAMMMMMMVWVVVVTMMILGMTILVIVITKTTCNEVQEDKQWQQQRTTRHMTLVNPDSDSTRAAKPEADRNTNPSAQVPEL